MISAERITIESPPPTPPAHLHLPQIEEELPARVLARAGALMAGTGGLVTGLAALPQGGASALLAMVAGGPA